jgi:hypothetical protein
LSRIDSAGSPNLPVPPPPPPPKPEVAPVGKTDTGSQTSDQSQSGSQQKSAAPSLAPIKDAYVDEPRLQSFDKPVRKDIQKLAGDDKATVTTNRDGSQTRAASSTGKGPKTDRTLTTRKGALGGSDLKYQSTKKAGKSTVTKGAEYHTDSFGRSTSSTSTKTTTTKGKVETASSTTTKNGARGLQTKSKTEETTRTTDLGKKGTRAKTTSDTTTTDNRGHASSTKETSTKVSTGTPAEGNKPAVPGTTTTASTKTTKGTTFSTAYKQGFAAGAASLGVSQDRKTGPGVEKSWNKEKEVKPASTDKGFTQNGKVEKAQKAADLASAAGLSATFGKNKPDPAAAIPPGFTGARAAVTGDQGVTVGPGGVSGTYNREATAGVYAGSAGSATGKYGTASYEAQAKAEAKASVDAQGKLDSNGLTASAGAKASAGVEASISGSASAKVATVGGVPINVGASGSAKVSAGVSAEATAKAQITRHPPTAIIEGSAGVSAVAKAEANVKVSAGPFSVTASGYASAGAEAKASGVIGYQDGKLKIGGSLGAAVGLGLGGNAGVEVDVHQLEQLAHVPQAVAAVKNAADLNHDGKVDAADAKAAVSNVEAAASSAIDNGKKAVTSAAKKVASWFGW